MKRAVAWLILLTTFSSTGRADNWPTWRGPKGQGLSDEKDLPEYEHLATNPLGEHTDASLAVSGGDIFIRTHKHLWCIGKKK